MNELYSGQSEIVAGKLAQEEAFQAADRERLSRITDSAEREVILRRIAGREGSLATRRRFLAKLQGEDDPGPKHKAVKWRLTDDEYDRLTSAAEAECIPVSQYLHNKVFG